MILLYIYIYIILYVCDFFFFPNNISFTCLIAYFFTCIIINTYYIIIKEKNIMYPFLIAYHFSIICYLYVILSLFFNVDLFITKVIIFIFYSIVIITKIYALVVLGFLYWGSIGFIYNSLMLLLFFPVFFSLLVFESFPENFLKNPQASIKPNLILYKALYKIRLGTYIIITGAIFTFFYTKILLVSLIYFIVPITFFTFSFSIFLISKFYIQNIKLTKFLYIVSLIFLILGVFGFWGTLSNEQNTWFLIMFIILLMYNSIKKKINFLHLLDINKLEKQKYSFILTILTTLKKLHKIK